jgi:hypothetical protein
MYDMTNPIIIFFASISGLTISIFFLWLSWRQLKTALLTLPPDSQKIIYNVKNITNKYIKRKAELMSVLHLACIFFGISVILYAFGMFISMTRFNCTAPSTNDLITACNVSSFGTIFFFSGFYALSLILILEFFSITRGKASPLSYQPPADASDKIKHEYEAVFKVGLVLKPVLIVGKKLHWWQKYKIAWGKIWPTSFAIVAGIFHVIQSFWDKFPSWPAEVSALVFLIGGFIVVIISSQQQ